MSGDIEWGICPTCGNYTQLFRKYYYYDINCECCRSNKGHFEIVRHCKDCKPIPPYSISVCMEFYDCEPIEE